MKKILDVDSQEFLDESVSNAIGDGFKPKDLFSKDAIKATLLSGGPWGAYFEAQRQAKLKAKAETASIAAQNAQTSAEKEIALAELEATKQQLAAAEQANREAIKENPALASKLGDDKKFPWLLVGGITFGVLALATTAYFVFRKKK